MKKQNYINILKIILFAPLTLYLGERSPVAYDEGFYILQSRWILLSNDWISPMYWGNLVLDRTNGIQILLALSQKIFGDSNFVFYIPSFLGGLAMIIFTNEIHKELVDKENQFFSILILSTTFLWINYFHMASQDILFASIITFGIFSSIKAFKTEKNIFLYFSGIWIGLAVMIKTYLAAIPLLAILPFLIKTKLIKSEWFWIGAFSGFIPFFIWSYKIILVYGFESFSGLYSKLLTLSKNNNFTNPFYYYLWNLILNALPWSIFSIVGFLKNFNVKDKLSHYFLFKYPLIIMIFLSIFSTKTPYYPIQILPIVSINAYLGIIYILKVKNLFTKIFNKFIFFVIPLLLISSAIYFNFVSLNIENEILLKIISSIALTSFSLSWLYSAKLKSTKKKLIFILIGPYLLFTILVQNGILNDRSKELRIASQAIIEKENLYNQKVEFITTGVNNEISTSKLIKLAIFMPKIGLERKTIENLVENQYAWTVIPKEEILSKNQFKIIADSKPLKPWILIKKK